MVRPVVAIRMLGLTCSIMAASTRCGLIRYILYIRNASDRFGSARAAFPVEPFNPGEQWDMPGTQIRIARAS